jgi:hypothetical protein
MNDNIIPPNEAGLVLHRFVTEAVPVLAWFVGRDRLVIAKVRGFVTNFERKMGLVISSESPAIKPGTSLPAYITFAHDLVVGSTFRYSDETPELPADFESGSGLRIDMPSGDTLTIAEIRRTSR